MQAGLRVFACRQCSHLSCTCALPPRLGPCLPPPPPPAAPGVSSCPGNRGDANALQIVFCAGNCPLETEDLKGRSCWHEPPTVFDRFYGRGVCLLLAAGSTGGGRARIYPHTGASSWALCLSAPLLLPADKKARGIQGRLQAGGLAVACLCVNELRNDRGRFRKIGQRQRRADAAG